MQEQLELHKEFREKQEKYAYYIVALCVTAIGFSVLQTSGKHLSKLQIPLGIGVLLWGLSIFCGLQFIGLITTSIYRNSLYLDMVHGRDALIGTHPERMRIALDVYKEGTEKLSKKSVFLLTSQERLFYLGIVCFLIWHVIEMYHQ